MGISAPVNFRSQFAFASGFGTTEGPRSEGETCLFKIFSDIAFSRTAFADGDEQCRVSILFPPLIYPFKPFKHEQAED